MSRLVSKPVSSSSRVSRPVAVPAKPCRRAVVVQAGLNEWADWFAKSFVRMMSPSDDKVKDWKDTAHSFTGSIDRERRPFKDGFTNAPVATTSSAEDIVPQVKTSQDEVVEYLDGAVKRVINNNFKGDSTEPKQWPTNDGWQGKIHTKREREGFHSKSY